MKVSNTRFQPGQSGNPAGKKPGTRNNLEAPVKAIIEKVCWQYVSNGQFQEDFNELTPKNRLFVLPKLLKFFMPEYTKAEVDLEANHSGNIEVTVSYKKTPIKGEVVNSEDAD